MKRFYREVTVAPAEGGWRVLLDGRAIKTVGGRPQIVPSAALAEAMAAEWAGQGEEIDTTAFLFRDMADYAIDVVATRRDEAVAAIVAYGESDTLCYRADPDEAFHARQRDVWEPVLEAAEKRHGVRFRRVSGIIHRPQPEATLTQLRSFVAAQDDFALAALRNLASLAASLVIALAALQPDADVTALWDAANLEEDWQAELWGKDAEAQARREKRAAAFAASARFAALSRAG